MVAGVAVAFSGCGGGGGGGSAPVPSVPTVPADTYIPDLNIYPTEVNIGDNVWYTNEYFASNVHDRIGSYGAWEDGYTGAGVTVAVVDSGVDIKNSDLDSNIVEGRDFAAFHYDTESQGLYYTTGGIGHDQVGEIFIGDGGSGYTVAPTITVIGDGVGAEAVALLNVSGEVEGVYITEHGTGYTNVDFVIDETGTNGSGLVIDDAFLGGETRDFHGTAVSGIVGAERSQLDPSDPYDGSTVGVAYDANIMPIKVFDNYGGATSLNVHLGIDYATHNGANVINLSLGSNSITSITSAPFDHVYMDAVQFNTTMVVASGNEGLNCLAVNGSIDGQCSFPAALPWVSGYEDLLNQDGGWIVVGAVDNNNIITSWSNKAGVTKNNYIVAPGENIISTSINDQMVMASGTSFAAPAVSGAVALMYQKYPHLTGSEISNILFSTATDLGAEGIDSVYGHGLLNLERAFSPIGELRVPFSTNVDSSTTPLIQTQVIAGSALAGAMINLSSINKTIAVDDYGRDFQVNMSSSISYGADTFDFDNFHVINYDGMLLGFDQLRQNIMIGYTHNGYNLMLGTTSDLFGTTANGSLGLENERSYYVTLRKSYPLSGDIYLSLGADYGMGEASGTQNSLISDVSTLHAIGGDIVLKHLSSGFGLGYSIPLKVVSGSMDFKIPVSREVDGSVNYLHANESMTSSSTEQRYSVFHTFNTRTVRITSSAEVIKDSFNINQDKLGYNLSLSGSMYF